MNASDALRCIQSNALDLQGVLQVRQDAKAEELIKKPEGLRMTLILCCKHCPLFSLGSQVGYSVSPALAILQRLP